MADCSKYSIQLAQEINALKQAQNTYNDLKSRVNNIQTVDQGDRLDELLGDLTEQFQFIESQFVSILRAAQEAGCPTQEQEAKRYAAIASNFAGSSFSSQQTAKSNTGKLRQEEQASRSASTKESNAGTGKPGTAGTGQGATPDAGGLEEVQIASKKSPQKISPTSDPGTSAAGGDGLEEVTVTAKRVDPTALDPNDPALQNAGNVDVTEPNFQFEEDAESNTNQGVPGATDRARSQATLQDTTNFKIKEDWRVRLSLSPGATYLYKDPENKLLSPLLQTDGVIFPYTPSIAVNYNANYGTVNPAHSNYTIYQYQNSQVDSVTLTCEFTAQDTYEANYLLAVIHFFRSITKMFYGKDENPKQGTPPPLVYLFGMGEFQFNAHPLAVTNFNYNLPNNVDYIRAGEPTTLPGEAKTPDAAPSKPAANGLGAVIQNAITSRLSQGLSSLGGRIGLTLTPGGSLSQPGFGIGNGFNSYQAPGTVEPTYVPTQITITVTCIPIISRYEISNNFSLKDYASGKLLQGVKRAGGGFW